MDDFKLIESEIQQELGDEDLRFEKEVKGGIVNKAALFSSSTSDTRYFIKLNDNEVASEMFEAESNSLDFLRKTNIINVPKSFKVLNIRDHDNNKSYAVHVLEYIPDLQPMNDYWSELGEKIARLHTFNSSLKESCDKNEGFVNSNSESEFEYVDKFGSLLPRYLGIFRLDPVQRTSWEEYFIGDILEPLHHGIFKKYGDRNLMSKWSWLRIHMCKLFQDVQITPEVNHGDLCHANFGQTPNGPVLFDPSVNYAHTEFDLLLSYHEESFHEEFFNSYHQLLPESTGLHKRMEAYKYFYNIIMWYHIDDDKYKNDAHDSADKIKLLIEKSQPH